MTFVNSLEPDQARQHIGPDLDPNCLTLMVFLKEIIEKVDFEKKISKRQKGMQNYYPVGRGNPESATYNLQQTTISNFAAFSKITNKA